MPTANINTESPNNSGSVLQQTHYHTLLETTVAAGPTANNEPLPVYSVFQADNAHSGRLVDIDANVAYSKKNPSQPDILKLKGVPTPVNFSDLCARIASAGELELF